MLGSVVVPLITDSVVDVELTVLYDVLELVLALVEDSVVYNGVVLDELLVLFDGVVSVTMVVLLSSGIGNDGIPLQFTRYG